MPLMDINSTPSSMSNSDGLASFEALTTPSYAFVVTIRVSAGGPSEWFGSVEEVQNHERIYFRDLARLDEFIMQRCNISPPHPSWRRRLAQRLQTMLGSKLKRGRSNLFSTRVPDANAAHIV